MKGLTMNNEKKFSALARQLEDAFPEAKDKLEEGKAAGSPNQGLFTAVSELIDALDSGDVGRISGAFKSVFDIVFGGGAAEQPVGPSPAMAPAVAAGFNWTVLLKILGELLPLLGGILGRQQPTA